MKLRWLNGSSRMVLSLLDWMPMLCSSTWEESVIPGSSCVVLMALTMEFSLLGLVFMSILCSTGLCHTGSSRTPGDPLGENKVTTGCTEEMEPVVSTWWPHLLSLLMVNKQLICRHFLKKQLICRHFLKKQPNLRWRHFEKLLNFFIYNFKCSFVSYL